MSRLGSLLTPKRYGDACCATEAVNRTYGTISRDVKLRFSPDQKQDLLKPATFSGTVLSDGSCALRARVFLRESFCGFLWPSFHRRLRKPWRRAPKYAQAQVFICHCDWIYRRSSRSKCVPVHSLGLKTGSSMQPVPSADPRAFGLSVARDRGVVPFGSRRLDRSSGDTQRLSRHRESPRVGHNPAPDS
jgi:hypothetical protein